MLTILTFAALAVQSPAPEYDGLYDEYMTWVYEVGGENFLVTDGAWKPPTFDVWIEDHYSIWIEPTTEIWVWTVEGWILEGYASTEPVIEPLPIVIDEPVFYYPALADVSASAIAYGQSVSGSLSADDPLFADQPVDYYAFFAAEGETIDLRLASADFDAYLRLTMDDGTYVAEDDDTAGGLGARLTLYTKYSGWYLIHATSYSVPAAGNYALSLDLFAGLPSDFPRTPIAVGDKLTGSLTDSDPLAVFRTGAEDAYELTLDAAIDLTIQLVSPDGTIDPYLYVLDGSGTRILYENDDYVGLDALISSSFEPGTYVLLVSTFDGVGGDYVLSVQPGLTEIVPEIYTLYEVRTLNGDYLVAQTGAELLAITVDPNDDWSTHGKYVSALTRGARDLVRAELLTQEEAARLVRDAARGSIGRKPKLRERVQMSALNRAPVRPTVQFMRDVASTSGGRYYPVP